MSNPAKDGDDTSVLVDANGEVVLADLSKSKSLQKTRSNPFLRGGANAKLNFQIRSDSVIQEAQAEDRGTANLFGEVNSSTVESDKDEVLHDENESSHTHKQEVPTVKGVVDLDQK